MNRLKYLSVCCLFAVLLAGCSSSTQFIYPNTQASAPKSDGLVLVCKNLNDQRNNKDLDKSYTSNPVIDIQQILSNEALSTGLFKTVGIVTDEQSNNINYLKQEKVDFLMEATIKKLEWEVPNYDAKLTTTFVVSFLTGGIGGLLFTAIPTDVYGHSIISMKIIDVNTEAVYLDKEYIGKSEESIALLKSDFPETKATVAGNAVKICMDQFKADLAKTIANKKNGKNIN